MRTSELVYTHAMKLNSVSFLKICDTKRKCVNMLWCIQVTENSKLCKQTMICSVVWLSFCLGKKKKTVQAILLTAGNSSFLSPSGLEKLAVAAKTRVWVIQ